MCKLTTHEPAPYWPIWYSLVRIDPPRVNELPRGALAGDGPEDHLIYIPGDELLDLSLLPLLDLDRVQDSSRDVIIVLFTPTQGLLMQFTWIFSCFDHNSIDAFLRLVDYYAELLDCW